MARGKKTTNTVENVKDTATVVEKNIEDTVVVNVETDEEATPSVEGETIAVETEESTDKEIKNKGVTAEASDTITDDDNTEEVVNTEDLKETVKAEEKAKPKRRVRYYEDVYGCNWNGQCFDY
jgi:hypothetical protein